MVSRRWRTNARASARNLPILLAQSASSLFAEGLPNDDIIAPQSIQIAVLIGVKPSPVQER